MVFVDRLTQMTRFAPTRTTVTAEDLATIFHRTVVSLHGMPRTLARCYEPLIGLPRTHRVVMPKASLYEAVSMPLTVSVWCVVPLST